MDDACGATRVTARNHPFIRSYINIYIRAFLLPELFPNSFPDVNTVCLRDPSGKPSGTRWRNEGSRGVPEAIEYSNFAVRKRDTLLPPKFLFFSTWPFDYSNLIPIFKCVRRVRTIRLSNHAAADRYQITSGRAVGVNLINSTHVTLYKRTGFSISLTYTP